MPIINTTGIDTAVETLVGANEVTGNAFAWAIVLAVGLVFFMKFAPRYGTKRAIVGGSAISLFVGLFFFLIGIVSITWVLLPLVILALGWVML